MDIKNPDLWTVEGLYDNEGTYYAICSTKENAERALMLLGENSGLTPEETRDMFAVHPFGLKLDALSTMKDGEYILLNEDAGKDDIER